MFTKPKKLEESLPDLTLQSQESSEAKLETRKTSLEKETKKRQAKEKGGKEGSLNYRNQNSSRGKNRNVSLPNLKLNKREERSTKEKRKIKKKQEVEDKRFAKRKKGEWDEVFFHYFSEFLERFVQEKKKKYRVPPSRQRLMS
jgi:hypothetical protein